MVSLLGTSCVLCNLWLIRYHPLLCHVTHPRSCTSVCITHKDTTEWLCGCILHELGAAVPHETPCITQKVFLCHGFNHFQPLNIINWSLMYFTKRYMTSWSIQQIPKSILLFDHVICFTSYITHTKCYIMWYASKYGITLLITTHVDSCLYYTPNLFHQWTPFYRKITGPFPLKQQNCFPNRQLKLLS